MSNSDAFREFAELRLRLAGMANGDVAREIRREIAKDSVELVRQGFRAETSPDGSRWATRKKPYPWPILRKSGKLYGATLDAIRYSVRGIEAQINLPYANAQNYGFPPHLPQRQYLPDPRKPLPAAWERAWTAAAERVMTKVFGRAVRAA